VQVAYLILAHKNADQLVRLIGRLGDEAPVFVHFDARARDAFARAEPLLRRFENVQLVERYPCYWGSFNIVRATLECIRALVASGVAHDYAMLLSGQDYPLRSSDEIRSFLEARRGAEFVECFPLDQPNRWTPQTGCFNATARVRYYHLQYRSRRFMLPVPRRFPKGFTPFGGSEWWCLTRECLRWLDGFRAERRDVVRFFEHVCVPDESFFQTAIAASPFAPSVVSDDLKFAIWNRPEPPYPAILRSGDLEALTRSGKLFARKFDETVDATVLDALDAAAQRSAGWTAAATESVGHERRPATRVP
jgi:hypothetical protein